MPGANSTKRRESHPTDFDYLFAAGGGGVRQSGYSLTSNVDRLIDTVEAERIADKICADANILHLMGQHAPSSPWNDNHFDLLDAPIPVSFFDISLKNIYLHSEISFRLKTVLDQT